MDHNLLRSKGMIHNKKWLNTQIVSPDKERVSRAYLGYNKIYCVRDVIEVASGQCNMLCHILIKFDQLSV